MIGCLLEGMFGNSPREPRRRRAETFESLSNFLALQPNSYTNL